MVAARGRAASQRFIVCWKRSTFLAHPGLRQSIGLGDFGRAAAFDNDSSDHQTGLGHPAESCRCRATSTVLYDARHLSAIS
jgi:hypothetical protein